MLWAALCFVLSLLPCVAQASVERFAVVIGSNRGQPDDQELRYAESDASHMFEVLRDLGGFQPANMVLLRDENADTVLRTLITVNDRIRAATSLPDGQALLFVYYSGHADADDLHLGETRLPISQLAQLARGSAATFRLVVLDACRSGTLTRVKGGKIRAKFELPGERMPEDGLAFLTATAANEDAQESDELRASFFTHALISGLLGAADHDKSGEVALDEAYRYAYEQTVRATSRTWSGTQHPAFRYDFRGQGSIILTRPEAFANERATVQLPQAYGVLLLRDAADGPVVAEVAARSPQRSISLRPGKYFVRARADRVLYEGLLDARAGAVVTVDTTQLQRIKYARLIRKGQSSGALAHALELGARVRSTLGNAQTPCLGAFAGYALDTAQLGARARISACTSSFDNNYVGATTNAYDADLRVYRAWDVVSKLTLEVGLGGGLSLFTQGFESRGQASNRKALAPFVALGAGAVLDMWSATYLTLDAAAETHFMRLRTDSFNPAKVTAQFGLRVSLGAGYHF
ncbi:MAG TPA: caspase family protein [Polyangiales bacterium]|nr:caspase family protein [Polyangiales bacterium]